MQGWLLNWLLSGLALLVVAKLLPGIRVDGFGSALIAAAVIGFVGATLGILLKIVLLPFILLSFGILYFIINGMMLMMASAIVPGFRVEGLITAVFGSVLLTLVQYVLRAVFD